VLVSKSEATTSSRRNLGCRAPFVSVKMEIDMNLGEFRKQTKDLNDNVLISVAEIDEAAAMNVSAVDVVSGAKVRDQKAEAQEAIDLEGGTQEAIVIRF
jgi:hypothetical protein